MGLNFRACLTIFSEIWSEEDRFFARYKIPSQTGHNGIFAIIIFLRRFKIRNKNQFEPKYWWNAGLNFRSCCVIVLEIWSKSFRFFAGSRSTSQTSDLGKIIVTFSLRIRLKFHKKIQKEDGLYYFFLLFVGQKVENITRGTSYNFALLKKYIRRSSWEVRHN